MTMDTRAAREAVVSQLQEYLNEHDLGAKAGAKLIGVHHSSLGQWLRGECVPGPKIAQYLADWLAGKIATRTAADGRTDRKLKNPGRDVLLLHGAGTVTFAELSKRLGASSGVVQRWCREAGIEQDDAVAARYTVAAMQTTLRRVAVGDPIATAGDRARVARLGEEGKLLGTILTVQGWFDVLEPSEHAVLDRDTFETNNNPPRVGIPLMTKQVQQGLARMGFVIMEDETTQPRRWRSLPLVQTWRLAKKRILGHDAVDTAPHPWRRRTLEQIAYLASAPEDAHGRWSALTPLERDGLVPPKEVL